MDNENWPDPHPPFDDEDREDSDETKHGCTNCRRELELGVDVLSVEKGVIGHRGVVPLGATQLFCSESCLSEFYDGVEKVTMKRRVP